VDEVPLAKRPLLPFDQQMRLPSQDEKTLLILLGLVRGARAPSLGHDISIRGNGVDEKGDIVSDGGVSMITITDLKPGTYTF